MSIPVDSTLSHSQFRSSPGAIATLLSAEACRLLSGATHKATARLVLLWFLPTEPRTWVHAVQPWMR